MVSWLLKIKFKEYEKIGNTVAVMSALAVA